MQDGACGWATPPPLSLVEEYPVSMILLDATPLADGRAAAGVEWAPIYATTAERTWSEFGEALEAAAAQQREAAGRPLAPQARDAAGFAAIGLDLAVMVFGEVDRDHRGTRRVWEEFTRLVTVELGSGFAAGVRSGLLAALSLVPASAVAA